MRILQKNTSAQKVALISGAAKRIGASIANTLHAEGMTVAVHYRHSEEEASSLCEKLNSIRSNSAKPFGADLTCDGAPETIIRKVIHWGGALDILVNNASSFYPTPLGQIDESSWADIIGTNLKAPLFLSQAAAPALRETKGNIINIVDIHGQRPLRDHHVYGAAKAGLTMLTRSLAKDLAPNIRVNAIAPGAIAWPESGLADDVKKTILGQVPLARTGDPADVAAAVLFFVKDAGYVTGQILAVDGGRSIGW